MQWGPRRVGTAASARFGRCLARDRHRWMLADPADGQKLGWIRDLERMGSPGGRVCETLRGLRRVFCSQSALRRLRTGRAHVLAWGTPRSARFAFVKRRVTSWLHMWSESGRRVNPCRMVPSKRDEVRKQLHDVTGRVQGARDASCRAGAARWEKKKLRKASLAFG